MRKLNEDANVSTIILAVATAITIAISILIIYSVIGGMNTTTIDAALPGTPSLNATNSLISGLGTFYTISPIYLVVLVAVAIIGAVMGMMYFRRQ
jgi:hypothetical protein